MRVRTWICCVEIVCGVAVLHIYALFWKSQFTKLCFRSCDCVEWGSRGWLCVRMRGSLQNSASILHRFKVLAMRIHTWLCCVERLYGVAILHVYALFWKTQFAKLSFRCFKTFDTSPALRGNLVLTTLLRNFFWGTWSRCEFIKSYAMLIQDLI